MTIKYLEITNPNRIIYPKIKIKKIDIINYYLDIAPLMLPFVKNRLLSVIRCHDDISGECFYKKHPTADKKHVEVVKIKNEEYFYLTNEHQLLFQAQNGTLEFHTWANSVKNENEPNIMVFDLDPDEKLSLKNLREATLKIKSILDDLDIISFLKTSGGKGYHIVIPFSKTKDWDSFFNFSKQIALVAETLYPAIFTTKVRKSDRKGKIFIDFVRNNKGSTCVAPYSLRARDNATISMPIAWDDIFNITPNEVNIKNYNKYINSAWNSFFTIKQEIK